MKKKFLYIAIGLIPFASCTTEPTTTDDCTFFTNSTESTIHLKNDPNKAVDYVISCVMNVSKDIIIDPGTVIQFSDDAGINVPNGGSLKAIGTSQDPIILTGAVKQKGSWKGIRIESNDTKNQLEFVTIEYAGEGSFDSNADKGAIIVNGKATINNCTIQHNSNVGINVKTKDCIIENTSFISNECPLRLAQKSLNTIKDNNTYSNNTKNHIWIDLDASSVNENSELIKTPIPYYFKYNGGSLYVSANLKIHPGVTIIMSPSSHIIVAGGNASLNAVGTTDEPIIFKGEIEQAGAWKNIYFEFTNSILNRLENVKIMHAGEDAAQTKGAVELWADPTITFSNVEFSQILGCEIKSHKENPQNLTVINATNEGNPVIVCQ